MKDPLKIVVAGAGLIGKRHSELVQAAQDMTLRAIVDPSDAGRDYANHLDVDWFASLAAMFKDAEPDGVILATPNQMHVENGLECVAAGCPILVEKPIATSTADAQKLVDAAKAMDVPLLVGHHRRHSPLIRKARELIDEGRLGRITAVHGNCWLLKPDDYFAPDWRRRNGAGPLMVNAIHDIDLLRYLCGDIVSVHGLTSNAHRGFENEETGVVLLEFQSGALGTMNVSDAVASPWSWEITAGENPEFPVTTQSCYRIGGTKGSLSVPDMTLWTHPDRGHWKTPISATFFSQRRADPLVEQLLHFGKVIRGEEEPLVSGEEGAKSLRVVEAVQHSIKTGETTKLPVGSNAVRVL